MLLDQLIALAGEPRIDFNVVRRVCMSLAALAVQMNEKGIVNDILSNLNSIVASSPRVLLELITVLPEECYSRYVIVDRATRRNFADQLSNSSGEVFAFLAQLVSACVGGGPNGAETERQILTCMERWIDNIEVPLNAVLMATGMLNFALSALLKKDLLEKAVDFVVVAIRRYPYSPGDRDFAIPATILSSVAAVRSLWREELDRATRGGDGPDEDACRCIAQLFAEVAEAFMELFVINDEFHQGPIFMQLLEIAKYTENPDIARMPLRAFYDLSVVIKDMKSTSDSATRADELAMRYGPLYLDLLKIAIDQMTADNEFISGARKLDEDEEGQRMDFRDSILDASDVIGSVCCVENICAMIQREILRANSSGLGISWPVVESCLYAIQILGPRLPSNENKFVPQVLALCAQLPQQVGLYRTYLQLIGSLSIWFGSNYNHIPAQFEILIQSLSVPQLCPLAANALMMLCRETAGCRNASDSTPILPLDRLNSVALHLRSTGTSSLSLEADLTILEGLAYAVSALEPPQAVQALKSLLEPIAGSLNIGLNNQVPAQQVFADVERVTVLFRYTSARRDVFQETHPVAELFPLMWPLLSQVIQKYPTDQACEKVCRCYKYVIRAAGMKFHSQLPQMIEHLVDMFSIKPASSFLYIVAICMTEFGDPGDLHFARSPQGIAILNSARGLLRKAFISQSSTFFAKFGAPGAFEHHPDVVEEFFYYASKAITYFPEFILSQEPDTVQLLRVLLQAGLAGLHVHHREALKGVLNFFGLFVYTIVESSRVASFGPLAAAQVNQLCMQMLFEFGAALVTALLLLLSNSAGGGYAVSDNFQSINDCLWRMHQLCPSELGVRISSILLTLYIILKRRLHNNYFMHSSGSTEVFLHSPLRLRRRPDDCASPPPWPVRAPCGTCPTF